MTDNATSAEDLAPNSQEDGPHTTPADQAENTNSSKASRGLHNRLLKSFGAETFANVTILLIQISTIPLFIYFWGKELYGEWLLLYSLPAYFAMSDLGFASAAGTDMTMKVAAGDKPGALRVFQSAWLFVSAISLFLIALALVLVPFLPISKWFHTQLIDAGQIKLILPVLLLQIIFALQRQLIALGYRSDGNFAVGSFVSSLKRLFDFLVMAAVLACGGKPLTVAVAYLLAEIFSNAMVAADVRRRSPWIQYGIKHADKATLKKLTVPALTFMGFPLGHALSLQGMLTVVGVTLGPGAVVLFSAMRTLTRSVGQILGSINNIVWVELSTAFGARNIELARKLHRRACQISLWLSIVLCLILLPLGRPIFERWTHGKVQFDFPLFLILLLVIACNSFWSASYVVAMAANRHGRVAMIYIGATVLSLIVASVTTRLIGIHGAALSLLLIDLAMITLVLPISLGMVSDHLLGYLRVVFSPPVELIARFSKSALRKPQ